MSTKPYLIINVVEGTVGIIRERPTWDEAVDAAVTLAAEQCDSSPDEIRKQFDDGDTTFVSKNGDIVVEIAQSEDD